MRNAFVTFHPGRKLISCEFSEMLPVGAGVATLRLEEEEAQEEAGERGLMPRVDGFKRLGDGASFGLGGPSLSSSCLREVQERIVSSFDVPVGAR